MQKGAVQSLMEGFYSVLRTKVNKVYTQFDTQDTTLNIIDAQSLEDYIYSDIVLYFISII